MEINKLPNSYEIFTPKIGLKTIEQICDSSKVKMSQISVGVTKLNDTEMKSAIEASSKRQLRLRVRKSKEKSNTLDDQEEWVFPNDDRTLDSDWSGQSDNEKDIDENTGVKARRTSVSARNIKIYIICILFVFYLIYYKNLDFDVV
jgi:hypothetical protein